MKTTLRWVLLSLFAMCASYSYADGTLKTKMDAFIVTTSKSGKEKLKPAKTAEPGQIIEYRIVNRNKGKKSLKNLVTDGPVPENTEYVAQSAESAVRHKLLVSIDGGTNYQAEPVYRTVVDSNGVEQKELVPASEYTTIRWVAKSDLKAKKKQSFSYRVRVK